MDNKPTQDKQIPPFYTVENVAEILKVTERTIYEYINSGKLEAYKIGKHYRITPNDFEKFIIDSKHGKKDSLFFTVGRESTEDEIEGIKKAFTGKFDIEINNSYMRLSEGDLPFILDISIGLVSAGLYDFLKAGIKKLFKSNNIKRTKSIVLRRSDEQYIFSDKRVFIRKGAEDIEFDSVDDLFNYIQK